MTTAPTVPTTCQHPDAEVDPGALAYRNWLASVRTHREQTGFYRNQQPVRDVVADRLQLTAQGTLRQARK